MPDMGDVIASYTNGLDLSSAIASGQDELITRAQGVFLDKQYYKSHNTKDINVFDDQSDWTGSASVTLADDTTNYRLNGTSVRMTGDTGTHTAKIDSITLDLSTFGDGTASSEDDYIVLAVYVQDANAASETWSLSLEFSQAATFSTTNMKRRLITSTLSTGWNFINIQKSDFTTLGSGAWSGIQSLRVGWQVAAGYLAKYVSYQLLQLVRKDPTQSKPNPFQRNIDGTETAEWTIPDSGGNATVTQGSWYLGDEYGHLIVRDLKAGNVFIFGTLISNSTYEDFDIDVITTYVDKDSNPRFSWAISDLQFLAFNIDDSGAVYITNFLDGVGGSPVSTGVTLGSLSDGDRLYLRISKKGDNFSIRAYKNADLTTLVSYSTTLTGQATGSGTVMIGTENIPFANLDHVAISTTEYAVTSGTAATAQRLNIKYKAGVFTVNDLSYGELGIDTSNSRLYIRFDDSTVKYAGLT